MTRIVGTLYGPDGPLNGRLFIKPSTPFIGFTKGVSFKIVDGQVDIELPPNTSTTVFQAGWRDQFDPGVVEYSERWHVPRGIEVSLDVVRGLKRRESTQAGRSTAGVDQAMWKMEAEKAQKRAEELDNDLKKALLTIKALEGRTASAAGKLASIQSECAVLQRKLAEAQKPEVRTEIVEKEVLSDTAKAACKLLASKFQSFRPKMKCCKSKCKQALKPLRTFLILKLRWIDLKLKDKIFSIV